MAASRFTGRPQSTVGFLSTSLVRQLAQDAYQSRVQDEEVFSAEFRAPIRERGYLTTGELQTITDWKSQRVRALILKNPSERIRTVTRAAFQEADPVRAVQILSQLRGVSTRMASAILAVYAPDRHTVLDYRAWNTLTRLGLTELGLSSPTRRLETHLDDPRVYGDYLAACRQLARRLGVSLRVLDQCLWALNGQTPEELSRGPKGGRTLAFA